jgi:hypothetical protein
MLLQAVVDEALFNYSLSSLDSMPLLNQIVACDRKLQEMKHDRRKERLSLRVTKVKCCKNDGLD